MSPGANARLPAFVASRIVNIDAAFHSMVTRDCNFLRSPNFVQHRSVCSENNSCQVISITASPQPTCFSRVESWLKAYFPLRAYSDSFGSARIFLRNKTALPGTRAGFHSACRDS
jgi:hypothetical protein